MSIHCFPGRLSDQVLDHFGPVLDAGGKPDCPEKNLRKQDWDRTRGRSEGKYAALTCFSYLKRFCKNTLLGLIKCFSST